eukprot:1191827-Prorocentrum_minimum.AAC.1
MGPPPSCKPRPQSEHSQPDSQTRQTATQPHSHTGRQTGRQADRQTDNQTETYRQTATQPHSHTSHTGRQTGRQKTRQIDSERVGSDVNELDPVRDEGIAFAQKCVAAAVPTEVRLVKGQPHPRVVPSHPLACPKNIPTLPASDWSDIRIYPRFLRLIGLPPVGSPIRAALDPYAPAAPSTTGIPDYRCGRKPGIIRQISYPLYVLHNSVRSL